MDKQSSKENGIRKNAINIRHYMHSKSTVKRLDNGLDEAEERISNLEERFFRITSDRIDSRYSEE